MPDTATSRRSACSRAAVLVPVLAATSCATLDADQARICRIAIVALEPPGSRITAVQAAPAEGGVTVAYRASGGDGVVHPHTAACRFALGRREDLIGLVRDGREIPGATVYLLNHYFIDTPEGRAADPGGGR